MLEVRHLSKSFGGLRVTRDISFTIKKGERRVILGPNGAGKTTLFNLLVGELMPTSGDIFLDGTSLKALSIVERAGLGLSRSYQKNNLFENFSIAENLTIAASAGQRKSKSILKDCFRDKGIKTIVEEVAELVSLQDDLNTSVAMASYGKRRQLEVGLALATKPRILLMDEPTSGIGPEMIDGFYRLLQSLPKSLTIGIIEHDLDLAFAIADKITVLNFGAIIFEGTPEETRSSTVVLDTYIGKADSHA